MRRRSNYAAVICLLVIATSSRLFAETRVLDYTFRSPSAWTFADGRVLNIKYQPREATRLSERNAVLYEIAYPQVVTQIIASENKHALLILVSRSLPSGGFNYDHVICVRQLPNDSFAFEKRLEARSGPITRGRWIVELGALSDDGETALIKMAEPSDAVAPYSVGKVWETWHLPDSTLLRSGLAICR